MIHIRVPPGEKVEFVSGSEDEFRYDPARFTVSDRIYNVIEPIAPWAGAIPWWVYLGGIIGSTVYFFPKATAILVAIFVGRILLQEFGDFLLRLVMVAMFAVPLIGAGLLALNSVSGIPLAAMTFGQAIGGLGVLVLLAIFVNATLQALTEPSLEQRREQNTAGRSTPIPTPRPQPPVGSALRVRDGARTEFPVPGRR